MPAFPLHKLHVRQSVTLELCVNCSMISRKDLRLDATLKEATVENMFPKTRSVPSPAHSSGTLPRRSSSQTTLDMSTSRKAAEALEKAREAAKLAEEAQLRAEEAAVRAEEARLALEKVETERAMPRRYSSFADKERDLSVGNIVAAKVGAGKYTKVKVLDIAVAQISGDRYFIVERLDEGKKLGPKPAAELFPLEALDEG
jgi:hypothetical protein